MILLDFEPESYKTPSQNIFYKCCPLFLLLVINCQNPLFFGDSYYISKSECVIKIERPPKLGGLSYTTSF